MKTIITCIAAIGLCTAVSLSAKEPVKQTAKKTTVKASVQPSSPRVSQVEKHEQDLTVPPRPKNKWSIFQIGFAPQWPGFTKVSNVYGLKLGIPMCSGYGRVYGVEPSILYSGTRHVWGIQASFWGVSLAQEIRGIQASSFGPSLASQLIGLQAVGTLGMADHVVGAQIAPVTMCSEDVTGFQFGVVNMAKPVTGFQAGGVNVAKDVTGFQLGVVNYAEEKGLQFGLVNIIKGGFLPFTLIINYSN